MTRTRDTDVTHGHGALPRDLAASQRRPARLVMSRAKFLGGIGLLMVCGRCHEWAGSGAGRVVKRCALGPLGRPFG